MHNVDTMFQFTFDLTKATLSTDSNPFVSGSGSSSSGGLSNGSSPVGSGGNGGSSFGGIPSDIEQIPTFMKAHGILMGTSVLLLFPIGAMFMRVVGSPLLHGIVQVLSLCVLIAGFGLGLRMAHILDIVSPPFYVYNHSLFLYPIHILLHQTFTTNHLFLIAL